MKLVWSKTGDDLDLDILDSPLVNYWLEQIEYKNLNSFSLEPGRLFDISIKTQLLTMLVANVNRHLPEDALPEGDCYDQDYLNSLHREWVKIQLRRPSIKSYLALKDPELSNSFDEINRELHKIERMCKYFYQTMRPMTVFRNPFMDRVESISQQHSHVFISYKNLGRTAWHKWSVGDTNLNDTDTNEYDLLSTDIILDVSQPAGSSLPKAFIDACSQAGVPAIGPELGLARFNLDRGWASIHTILRRNVQPENFMQFYH